MKKGTKQLAFPSSSLMLNVSQASKQTSLHISSTRAIKMNNYEAFPFFFSSPLTTSANTLTMIQPPKNEVNVLRMRLQIY